MEGDLAGRKLNQVLSPPVTRNYDKFIALKEELLPGIPNGVTLDRITTKMPWTTLRTLSSVSRAWKQAIQDRLIDDSRVRTHSSETIVVLVRHGTSDITLYSLSDKVSYNLPPIPQFESGFPWESYFITLNGKIYILGGIKQSDPYRSSKEVYVLDVAGQGKWEQCASMHLERHHFACGVIDGKIYVFGGIAFISEVGGTGIVKVLGSEVYDPDLNVWSARRPMTQNLDYTTARTVGEELWVYTKQRNPFLRILEVYDPVKDDWRRLFTWRRRPGIPGYIQGALFGAHGKFCSMTISAIYAYDIEIYSWTELHTFSLSRMFWPSGEGEVRVHSVLAVDDKLLATVSLPDLQTNTEREHFLVQSTGLGGKDKEMVWEKSPCCLPLHDMYYHYPLNSLRLGSLRL